jgi:hypothetical protein
MLRGCKIVEDLHVMGYIMRFMFMIPLFTKGASIFQETMGKKGRARRLTILDKFYIPFNIGEEIRHA